MPLLISPIDGSPMRQIKRHGIEIDVCPTTGGVWLDRGELEKLMMMIKEEAESESFTQPASAPMPPQRPHNAGYRHDDDDRYKRRRDYDDDDYNYKKGYKKSKMSKIMDIFDF